MRSRLPLLITAAVALACGDGDAPAPEPEPDAGPESGPAETRPLTEGLALWRADGFTLLVPEGADVVPRKPEASETWAGILAGPGFLREVDGATVPGPPAYRMDLVTYAKPDTASLEEWVAARLAERGEDAPPGIRVPLAGEGALRTGAPPGEAGPTTYWLERGGKVVELRLAEEPESPLAGIQRHLLALVLSTFRWSGETSAP